MLLAIFYCAFWGDCGFYKKNIFAEILYKFGLKKVCRPGRYFSSFFHSPNLQERIVFVLLYSFKKSLTYVIYLSVLFVCVGWGGGGGTKHSIFLVYRFFPVGTDSLPEVCQLLHHLLDPVPSTLEQGTFSFITVIIRITYWTQLIYLCERAQR